MSAIQYEIILYMLWMIFLNQQVEGSFSYYLAIAVLIMILIFTITREYFDWKIRKLDKEVQ